MSCNNHTIGWNSSTRKLIWVKDQLGLYCRQCGKWLKWVPQNAFWLDIAPSKKLE